MSAAASDAKEHVAENLTSVYSTDWTEHPAGGVTRVGVTRGGNVTDGVTPYFFLKRKKVKK